MGISVEGQKCPICGAYMFDNDDLVFCPECGAPHHRDCYEAIGHCAYKDKHGTPEGYNPEAAQKEAEQKQSQQGNLFGDEPHFEDNTTPCRFCGEPLAKTERVCHRCGRPQMASGTPPFGGPGFAFDPLGGVAPNEQIGDVTADEIKSYVVVNTQRYVPRFKGMKVFKRSSWNWAAFLIPEAWFFYRKMYLPGILVTMLLVITNLFLFPFSDVIGANIPEEARVSFVTLSNYITENFKDFNGLPLYLAIGSIVASLAIRIVLGFFGDKIYLNTVTDGIKTVKSAELDVDTTVETALSRKGGVNSLLGLVCLFAFDIIVDLIHLIYIAYI